MLQAHDEVPHFVVTDVDGTAVTYGSIWQQSHLVLVSLGHKLPAEDRDREGVYAYVRDIRALAADDLAVVVTREASRGFPPPAHSSPIGGARSSASRRQLTSRACHQRTTWPSGWPISASSVASARARRDERFMGPDRGADLKVGVTAWST
jgi:hypothetical protein